MFAEAPYLFSIAGLSVTLAGFAGLVSAFRRGGEWAPMDLFRLREIAEFGLGNALITLSMIPLATTTDMPTAIRTAAALGVLFIVGGAAILTRRSRELALPADRSWYWLPAIVDVAAIAPGLVAIITQSIGAFEFEILFMLARPMIVFVLVLGALRR